MFSIEGRSERMIFHIRGLTQAEKTRLIFSVLKIELQSLTSAVSTQTELISVKF